MAAEAASAAGSRRGCCADIAAPHHTERPAPRNPAGKPAVQKKTVTPARTPIGLPGVKWMAPSGVTGFLPGLAKQGRVGARLLDLAPDARVVGELRLAPVGVGEVQELDASSTLRQRYLREQVEQEVARAPSSESLLVGRPVVEVAAAQRHREAVVEAPR